MPIILDPNSVNSTMGFITNLRGQRIQDRQFGEDLEFKKQQLDVTSDLDRQRINQADSAARMQHDLGEQQLAITDANNIRVDTTERQRIKSVFDLGMEGQKNIERAETARIAKDLGEEAATEYVSTSRRVSEAADALNGRALIQRQELMKRNGGAPVDDAAFDQHMLTNPEGRAVLQGQVDAINEALNVQARVNTIRANRYGQLGEKTPSGRGRTQAVLTERGIVIASVDPETGEAVIATKDGANGGTLNGGDDVTVIRPSQFSTAVATELSKMGAAPNHMWGDIAEKGTNNERALNPVEQAVMNGGNQQQIVAAQDDILARLAQLPGNSAPNPQKDPNAWSMPGVTQNSIPQDGLRTKAPTIPVPQVGPGGGDRDWKATNAARNVFNNSENTKLFGQSPSTFEFGDFYQQDPNASWKDVGGYAPVKGQAPGYSMEGLGTTLTGAQARSGMISADHAATKMEGLARGRNYSTNVDIAKSQQAAEAQQRVNDNATRGDYAKHVADQMTTSVQEIRSTSYGLKDPKDVERVEAAFERRTGQKLMVRGPDGTTVVNPKAATAIARAYKDNPEAILKAANLNPKTTPRELSQMTPHQRNMVTRAVISSLSPQSGLRTGAQETVDFVRNIPVINLFTDTGSADKTRYPFGQGGSLLNREDKR